MSKKALLGTSLVAALPAAYLTYLLVMTFINRSGNMATMMYVVAGLTLAVSASVALVPVGILLFSPGAEKPPKQQEDASDDQATAAAEDDLEEDDLEEDDLGDDDFDEDDDEYEFDDDED